MNSELYSRQLSAVSYPLGAFRRAAAPWQ